MRNTWQRESTMECKEDENGPSPTIWNSVASLSEAQGVNGSPVIVFKKCPEFGELHAQDLSRLLINLTIMSSVSEVGYTLVIDGRQDKWTAVKKMLKHIARSFPTDLQLVLVLKPTSWSERFFDRTMFKSLKKAFSEKVPVFMLRFVAELANYIDLTPPELQDQNKKHMKTNSKYNHLKRQYQSQSSLEICLKETEIRLREKKAQIHALEIVFKDQSLHECTLKKEFDNALAQRDTLKTCLEELDQQYREVLMCNEQLQNEMSRLAQIQTEVYQKLTQKDQNLKQQHQSQWLLEIRLKDTESRLREEKVQRHALEADLQNQLLHAETLQKKRDKVLCQKDNLKNCLEELNENCREILSSNHIQYIPEQPEDILYDEAEDFSD